MDKRSTNPDQFLRIVNRIGNSKNKIGAILLIWLISRRVLEMGGAQTDGNGPTNKKSARIYKVGYLLNETI